MEDEAENGPPPNVDFRRGCDGQDPLSRWTMRTKSNHTAVCQNMYIFIHETVESEESVIFLDDIIIIVLKLILGFELGYIIFKNGMHECRDKTAGKDQYILSKRKKDCSSISSLIDSINQSNKSWTV